MLKYRIQLILIIEPYSFLSLGDTEIYLPVCYKYKVLYVFPSSTTEIPGGPLLTWFNFNPSVDKYLHPLWSVGWNYLPIPKRQQCNHWSLGMDKRFHLTLYWACDYLSMLGFRLIHVNKRDYSTSKDYTSVTSHGCLEVKANCLFTNTLKCPCWWGVLGCFLL